MFCGAFPSTKNDVSTKVSALTIEMVPLAKFVTVCVLRLIALAVPPAWLATNATWPSVRSSIATGESPTGIDPSDEIAPAGVEPS